MQEEEADAPGVQQWHKGPRRKTAPTSEKGEDTQRGHQAEPKTGDNEINSRVFHRATRTGGRDVMEVSAPAETEEVVPERRLGGRPRRTTEASAVRKGSRGGSDWKS
jgi:hypothetical protein